MIKKIITLLLLVMIVCTGCGKKQKEEQIANDLETIIKRDEYLLFNGHFFDIIYKTHGGNKNDKSNVCMLWKHLP